MGSKDELAVCFLLERANVLKQFCANTHCHSAARNMQDAVHNIRYTIQPAAYKASTYNEQHNACSEAIFARISRSAARAQEPREILMATVPHLSKGYHACVRYRTFPLARCVRLRRRVCGRPHETRTCLCPCKGLHNLGGVQECRKQHKMTARSIVHCWCVLSVHSAEAELSTSCAAPTVTRRQERPSAQSTRLLW